MHLILEFPAGFTHKRGPGEQRIALLPSPAAANAPAGVPDAIVTYGPIRIKPDEPRPWQEGIATGDLVEGTRAKPTRLLDVQTVHGWPLRVVEVEVYRGDTDELVELRLCGFYTFMEHAAHAIVRTGSRARHEANAEQALAILRTGRPDWRGEPVCVADAWDLESDPALTTRDVRLAQLELASATAARGQVAKATELLDARAPAAALVELDAALAAAPDLELAHYLRGVALGALGRHADAIDAWERAATLLPDRADTIYNIAQARFALGEFAAALAAFDRVTALDPGDFLAVRKVVQCLYALDRLPEAQAARAVFRERWARSTDPRARLIDEYVFDQIPVNAHLRIHAVEPLRQPANAPTQVVLAFRAVEVHGAEEHGLPVAIVIETSAQARDAGTPYVLGVHVRDRFRVIGTARELPAYAALKRDVIQLVLDGVAALAPS